MDDKSLMSKAVIQSDIRVRSSQSVYRKIIHSPKLDEKIRRNPEFFKKYGN